MEDDKIEKYVEGDLIIDNNQQSNEKIKIPKEIFSRVIKSLQEHKKVVETIETVEEIKKSTKTVYEVIMKPELEEGINSREYKWKDCALEVRNVDTGQYVGKGVLEKSDALDIKEIKTTVIRDFKDSALSKLTKSICSISGQIQLAEISQKIDVLNEKVDEIKELIIHEKVYELKACIDTIEKDIRLLPDINATNRINDCILKLRGISNFFEGEIQKVINKKVNYSMYNSFVEGLNIINLFTGEVAEYNKKYINEIKFKLNQYSILLDYYFQSVISLGTCYQILHGYNEGKEYYEQAKNKVNKFSEEVSNNLQYLLEINRINDSEFIDLNNIIQGLEDRKINLKQELLNVNGNMKIINNKYKNLTNQFDKVEIKLLISEDELLKEEE